jgi:hypothetical protein
MRDYEYGRGVSCSISTAVGPKAGRRLVLARRCRKRLDFARFVRTEFTWEFHRKDAKPVFAELGRK